MEGSAKEHLKGAQGDLGQVVGTARGEAASPRVISGAKAGSAVWGRTSRER